MRNYKSDTLRSTIKKIPVPKIMLADVTDLMTLWIYFSKEVLLVPYWPTGKYLERGVHDLMEVYGTPEFYGGNRPELDQDDIQEFHGSTMPGLHGSTTPGFYWGIIRGLIDILHRNFMGALYQDFMDIICQDLKEVV